MFRSIVTDVFFDLDHTLWDFEKNSALTFNKILKENDINVVFTDFLEVYIPCNLNLWKLYREDKITKTELRYKRLKTVFDKLNYKISDTSINHLADEYITYLAGFNHLFENAIKILDYLSPKYRLHIITNGFQEIQDKKLKGANIYSYFDQIIHSETAGVKKPNPLIFKTAMRMAKVAPDHAIMIGDNLEADIVGAKATGMHTIHFNAHNEPPHVFCPMVHDLIEIKTYL